jgi:hypothetical protein
VRAILENIGKKDTVKTLAAQMVADEIIIGLEELRARAGKDARFDGMQIEPETRELFQWAYANNPNEKYSPYIEAQKVEQVEMQASVPAKRVSETVLVLILVAIILFGLGAAYADVVWSLLGLANSTLASTIASNVSDVISNITNVTNIGNVTGNISVV